MLNYNVILCIDEFYPWENLFITINYVLNIKNKYLNICYNCFHSSQIKLKFEKTQSSWHHCLERCVKANPVKWRNFWGKNLLNVLFSTNGPWCQWYVSPISRTTPTQWTDMIMNCKCSQKGDGRCDTVKEYPFLKDESLQTDLTICHRMQKALIRKLQ